MIPVEDVRLLAAGVLVSGRWHFPEPPCRGPFPAVLMVAPVPSAGSPLWLAELLLALPRRGIAVLEVRDRTLPAAALPEVLLALRAHHLASKVRLGAVVLGDAARELPPLEELASWLRVDLRPELEAGRDALLPTSRGSLQAAAEWRAARAIAARLHAVLVPAWEQHARRPGTAIG